MGTRKAGGMNGVYGQRYNITGQPEGAEFQVSTYIKPYQGCSEVTAFSDGGFVVMWSMVSGKYSDIYGVYGRRYDAKGQPRDAEFQVNTNTTFSQGFPVVSLLNNSSFIVVWNGEGYIDDEYIYQGIYARFSGVSLMNNRLAIKEGTTAPVTLNLLSATSMEAQDNNIVFTIDNVQHGWFEHVNQLGAAITSFTQQAIRNNAIQFVHDGSDNAPSYGVKANDGQYESPYQTAQITFTYINDIPRILNNQLTITQGKNRDHYGHHVIGDGRRKRQHNTDIYYKRIATGKIYQYGYE